MTTPEEVASLDAKTIDRTLEELDVVVLAGLVQRANREYWDEATPTLPDPLYDRIVQRLRALQPDHPVLEEMGPSAIDGETLSAEAAFSSPPEQRLGHPVEHLSPMLSLDKCYADEDLLSWVEKFEGEVLVMPKMDGVACSLRYDGQGHLRVASDARLGARGRRHHRQRLGGGRHPGRAGRRAHGRKPARSTRRTLHAPLGLSRGVRP